MSDPCRISPDLPLEQQAIRAKCFHPTGTFVEFKKEEIEQSIPDRFEKIVRQYPNRLAVKAQNTTLTYDALNRASNRIARIILAYLGEGEEPVAFLVEHGAGLIAAIFGILKAGKIYVALDPAFPHTRTAYMLEDSEARLLLTDRQHLPQAEGLAQRGQIIVNCDAIEADLDSENLGRAISPETRALILYTSGSTGHPKGVLHNHRNVLVEAMNYSGDVRLCAEDRVAVWHSFSYAKSNRNMDAALLNGAALFAYDLAALGFAPLAEWMQTNGINILDTLPTTFRRLCEAIAPDAMFPALRVLRLGGESISRADVILFQRHFSSGCVLMHAIGPTESSTIRRYFIGREWRHSDGKIPLGYPVAGKQVLLLDETGCEVGADQIGEIAVRSKHLALGYWRRADLTRTAFISDPRGGDERLYLTGDLGVMRSDGCLIHMGRKDFQVKIRGYRIEVGEIEAALFGLGSIKAAVVHAQADNALEPRLAAYVVPAPGNAPTVSELRRRLSQTLPDYMVPSAFVFLDTLPTLPNGKIDRRALPAPEHSRPALDSPFSPPGNSIEKTLAEIWSAVLWVGPIGIHDDFFELGGHSLAAMRVVSQVIKTFQLEIPLQSLFQSPTVAEMAAVMAAHKNKTLSDEKLKKILSELESLSDEDARRLLANQAGSDDGKN